MRDLSRSMVHPYCVHCCFHSQTFNMCKMVWVFCICGVKIFSKFEECSVENCEFAETETRTSVTVKCDECKKKLSDGTKKAVSLKNFILS